MKLVKHVYENYCKSGQDVIDHIEEILDEEYITIKDQNNLMANGEPCYRVTVTVEVEEIFT